MGGTYARSVDPTYALAYTPEPKPVATPDTVTIYTDGAYSKADEGGTQKGGFGVIVVTGGDGGGRGGYKRH